MENFTFEEICECLGFKIVLDVHDITDIRCVFTRKQKSGKLTWGRISPTMGDHLPRITMSSLLWICSLCPASFRVSRKLSSLQGEYTPTKLICHWSEEENEGGISNEHEFPLPNRPQPSLPPLLMATCPNLMHVRRPKPYRYVQRYFIS